MAIPHFKPAWLAIALALVSAPAGIARAMPMNDENLLNIAENIHAPEFAPVEWLNTDKPLKLADLKGQVVLIDFWTYCCINCMHIFPDLRFLEEKYHDQPLVVIGCHSGKFSQEKDAANIRQAILRHNISHPVAVDSDFAIWKSFSVRAWPTLAIIDPEGNVVGLVSGEGHREGLDRAIAKLLADHKKKGTLKSPMKFRMERESFATGVLEFPGKVLADPQSQRLVISDTNHHRVLISDLSGAIQHVIGAGTIGLADGPFDKARFHQPQGLALSADGKKLYVADTENHALRVVDLENKSVATLAGNGKQSNDYNANGPGTRTALSSPWDLALVGDRLYIAMAGTHQIWVYDIKRSRVSVFAGTGREAGIQGPNRSAAFAQPSGLATDGQVLYVADSEISSIRSLELKSDGKTSLFAGGGELFEFGDADGEADRARFQHPLGVALSGNTLFAADTFNHRIRTVDLKTREVATWLGTGRPDPGTPDKIGLFEPGGLCAAGDTLYVADTNHHRILAVDIKSRVVRILDVRPPKSSSAGT